jgi:hypothetical protein
MIEMERHVQGEDYQLGWGVEVSADGEGIRVERRERCCWPSPPVIEPFAMPLFGTA